MTALRLWSDEIDAMRPEAREVVAAGLAAFAEMLGIDGTPPSDPFERAAAQRAPAESAASRPCPEAVEREIAGVRCRIFTPDGPARGIYLHFHGGGMVVGKPEMNDLGNRATARSPRRRGGVGRLPAGARAPVPGRPRRRRRRRRVAARARRSRVRSVALRARRRVGGRVHGRRGAAAHARRARRDRSRGRRQPRVRRPRLGPVAEPARDPSERRTRHPRSRGHPVLRRLLRARSHRRRAARSGDLAGVRRPRAGCRRCCAASGAPITWSTTPCSSRRVPRRPAPRSTCSSRPTCPTGSARSRAGSPPPGSPPPTPGSRACSPTDDADHRHHRR